MWASLVHDLLKWQKRTKNYRKNYRNLLHMLFFLFALVVESAVAPVPIRYISGTVITEITDGEKSFREILQPTGVLDDSVTPVSLNSTAPYRVLVLNKYWPPVQTPQSLNLSCKENNVREREHRQFHASIFAYAKVYSHIKVWFGVVSKIQAFFGRRTSSTNLDSQLSIVSNVSYDFLF